MKRNVKVLAVATILILIISLRVTLFARNVSPPPPSVAGHGQLTSLPPEHSSAPVGNGIAFILSLGAGYLVLRHYRSGQKIDDGVQLDF